MTRRGRILLSAAALAACVGIALGVLAMLPPRPGVTKANFDRIEDGMTLVEIVAILGEPTHSSGGLFHKVQQVHWLSDDGASARAILDGEVVATATWNESTESIPDKLRRWLHLPPAE